MNLLTLAKKCQKSRCKWLLMPAYVSIVAIELSIEYLLDLWYSRRSVVDELKIKALDDVTVLIKTFERPAKLKRLVRSIRRFYPLLKIIIVDDSRKPLQLDGVQMLYLPFASGVSRGRNAGLAAVRTLFTLVLDDDFIFNRHTDLVRIVNELQRNPAIDILAGEVVYLPFRRIHDYRQGNLYPSIAKPLYTPGSQLSGLSVRLKVPNFYLGRTHKIRQVGWDDQIMRLDHADFFTRAIGVLTCVQDPSFKVLHDPTYFKASYLQFRNNCIEDRHYLKQKYCVDSRKSRVC